MIDIWLIHLSKELAGVGTERLHVTSLPFGVDGIEREGGLSRPRKAGDDDKTVTWNFHGDVLEVVLTSADDDNLVLRHKSIFPGS